ncbi:TusE/DsrC/DsvC family sulfur relay protein [Wenzhouxiangella marina]|uniref:Sulfurtransferase n=1 Tax=Wenzhouxiangella marina TaxID=1579979 RepID=A0A0K0XXG9_9GAMM|nr:TusE/DsrC/DsvC family sulfur relay protein [Wenzhouxiangella marina]AKS42394.1 Sulfur transfer protein TusE [Wenzhouxiangella marina]MBB6085832.1 tRNA 2-thiouridine synthesizing protein E [Wenzhouxiangella marina]
MSDPKTFEFQGELFELDADGHLLDPSRWSPALARAMAAEEGVELSDEQWWLIRFVREHQTRYGTPPLMRVVVAALREARADPDLTSRDVYRLFRDNPVREACRLGGYPKPDWCI